MLSFTTSNETQSIVKWLSVVGIGEDGIIGLSPVAKSLLDKAEIIVGGSRHLAMLPPNDTREKLLWNSPIETTIKEIIKHRMKPVCILASGDPMFYGIGATLTRRIPLAEMTIIPHISAFSFACSRLGWSFSEVETLSLCGRDPNFLNSVLYPGAKLLILSAGKVTPQVVTTILNQAGFKESKITVLERLGGEHERIIEGISENWNYPEISDLNTIAVECISAEKNIGYSRLAGLPDNAYYHDGQLTKREIRSVTLAALSPLPGQLLWDVGAGCGSISIEWMRAHRQCSAIAIEQNSTRLQYIANNASALGVPNLKIIAGNAPESLKNLPQPQTIFIGGGLTKEHLFETCWNALETGGRLVANAVTIESEQKIFEWQQKLGGTLSRIAIQRAEPIGKFLGWKAMSPVTQWVVVKQ